MRVEAPRPALPAAPAALAAPASIAQAPDAGPAEPEQALAAVEAPPPEPSWPTPAQRLLEATRPGEYAEDAVAGGVHVRFGTDRGPVHVWRPAGYDPASAGLVVYLHGYFDHVDSAWDEHRLAEQFAQSGQNALFIVPEAPSGRADEVFWKDLGELLNGVRRRTRLALPRRPLIAVGHSGAYRTLASWLDEPRLGQLILLDGLYGYDDEIAAWLSGGNRRLVLVAVDTAERTEAFLRRFPKAVRVDELPDRFEGFSPEQRSARILYLPTARFDHMGLVTEGKVLPLILKLAPLKPVQPESTGR